MIKVTKKGIQIKGGDVEILTNLTVIIHAVKEAFEGEGAKTEEVKQDVLQCVDLAFKSKEELKAETMQILDQMFGCSDDEDNEADKGEEADE